MPTDPRPPSSVFRPPPPPPLPVPCPIQDVPKAHEHVLRWDRCFLWFMQNGHSDNASYIYTKTDLSVRKAGLWFGRQARSPFPRGSQE